jgi:hypothetical protein
MMRDYREVLIRDGVFTTSQYRRRAVVEINTENCRASIAPRHRENKENYSRYCYCRDIRVNKHVKLHL